MTYYLFAPNTLNGPHFQVWHITDSVAVRIGVSNPESGPATYFKAADGESVWDSIQKLTPWFEPDGINPFHKITLSPGTYYPRMARPIDQHPFESPGTSPGARYETDVIAVALGQLTTLTRQLDRICQTIHPTEQNFDTYGHDIRNLLIVACTEVETHWRGVLVANGLAACRT